MMQIERWKTLAHQTIDQCWPDITLPVDEHYAIVELHFKPGSCKAIVKYSLGSCKLHESPPVRTEDV